MERFLGIMGILVGILVLIILIPLGIIGIISMFNWGSTYYVYKTLDGEEGEARYCGKNYGMLYCETYNGTITVESFTREEKEKK